MTTYADIVRDLGLEQVCLDASCGLDEYRQRGAIDGFGVIHWRERRYTRRGLRRLLLLVARRERETMADTLHHIGWPVFLNDPQLSWYHRWWEEQRANAMAAKIGVRFPAAWSKPERLACLAAARDWPISRTHPAIYSWANR